MLVKDDKPIPPDTNDKNYIRDLADFLLKVSKEVVELTGGILSVVEFYSAIKDDYKNFDGDVSDVLKALKRLEKDDLIVGVRKLKDGDIKIVEFLPVNLTDDLQYILNIAASSGYITIGELLQKTGWDEYRVRRALDTLEKKTHCPKSRILFTRFTILFPRT